MIKVLAVQSVSGERNAGKMCLPRQKAHGIYIYMKSGEDRRCLLRQKATKEGEISGIYCANSCACFLPSVPDSSENVRTQAAIASRPAACAEGKEVSFVSGFFTLKCFFWCPFFIICFWFHSLTSPLFVLRVCGCLPACRIRADCW